MDQLNIKARTLPELLDLSAKEYGDQVFVVRKPHKKIK